MSTSPSWFDQEKFSRLVKKVGPKPGAEGTTSLPHATPPAPVGDSETAEETQESLASTARISLVSRPPSLMNEHRALPALPRRTGPMPGLKSIFKFPTTPEPAPAPPVEIKPEVKTAPLPPVEAKVTKHQPVAPPPEKKPEAKVEPKFEFKPEPKFEFKPLPKPEIKPEPQIELESKPEPETATMGVGDEDDLDAIWMKMALLNEELAQTIRERDQAFHDNNLLRDQLESVEETIEQHTGGADQSEAMLALTQERDQARKEYVDLRKQFETLKREHQAPAAPAPREESLKFRKELEQQLEGFRLKLEERNKEIAALKAAPPVVPAAPVVAPTASGDVTSLRAQLDKAKEEASIAQRGLALSQKALHETRMTLREATEGTSLSRHNFDNLKAECAALTQQNTVLQAQNDQLLRELAAAKSKLTTRL